MKTVLLSLGIVFLSLNIGYAQVASPRNALTLPFIEDFESISSNLYFPPAGWTMHEGTGVIARPPQVPAPTNWTLQTSAALALGTRAAQITSQNRAEHDAWLITPEIAIPNSGDIQLKFWSHVSMGQVDSYHEIWVSTTGNQPANFTRVKLLPNDVELNTWNQISVPLNEFLGENIHIAFRYRAEGHSRRWIIDDIVVADWSQFADVEVVEIIAPVTGDALTGAEAVKVLVRNNGVNAISNFEMQLERNGTLVATETFTGTIAGESQVEFTFATTLNLSAHGVTTVIRVTANLDGDLVPSNNSQTKEVTNTAPVIISVFPHFEDFECEIYNNNPSHTVELPAGWRAFCFNTCNVWLAWGPHYNVAQVRSGQLAVRRMAEFFGRTEDWLVTPRIVIPATGFFTLEFWSRNLFPQNNRYNGVWISTEGQNPATAEFVELRQLRAEFGEISDYFKKITILLNDFAGQEVYIAFKYISEFGGDTWIIDDVMIADREDFIDAAVLEITSPMSDINLTDSEQVSILIQNHSLVSITGFSLKLEHNGVEIATEIFTGTIPALSRADFTFAATLDLSEGGNHTIRATVLLDGDEIPENNSVTRVVENYICHPVTAFPWRFSFPAGIPRCWRRAVELEGAGWVWVNTGGIGRAASFAVHDFGMLGYVPINVDNWLMTPQIVLDRDLTLSFRVGAAHPQFFYETYSVLISTTGTALEDFTEIFTETLTEGGAEMRTVRLSLREFTGESVFIAWRHWDTDPNYALAIAINEVEVFEFTDFIDAEVTRIISPRSSETLTANENVSVQIRNNGSSAISNFTLTLTKNETEIATETFTGTIESLSSAEYTFNAALDLSRTGEGNRISVTINVPGDEVPSNNSSAVTVARFSSESVALTGYRISDDSRDENRLGFVTFNSNSPGTITQINNYRPSNAVAIFAGEYAGGYFYYYSVDIEASAVAVNFVKMSADTWTVVASTPVTSFADEMAFDYTTNTMFGTIRTNPAHSTLVEINLEDGTMTTIGALDGIFYALAFNSQGQLFGIDRFGRYSAINKTNAAVTRLNSTGFYPMFSQSMTYDHNTGRMFWAAVSTRAEARLIEIEPNSGAVLDRGALANTSQITGLHTPHSPKTSTPQITREMFSIFPNPVQNTLNISTEQVITLIEVIDLQGRIVLQQQGNNRTVNLQSVPAGTYTLRIHTQSGAFSTGFVKQ